MAARFNYRVQPHDSLWKISKTHLGDASRWPEVARLNGLKPPYKLLVGLPLRLPERKGHGRHVPPPLLARPVPGSAPTPPGLNFGAGLVPGMSGGSGGSSASATPSRASPLAPPPGGDAMAGASSYPTLKYKGKAKAGPVPFPGGEFELEFEAELEIQRDSALTLKFSDQEFEALAKAYGVSGSLSGKPLGKDPVSLKIKSEYDAKLVKVFSEAKVMVVGGKPQIEMQIGWKFDNCSYAFKAPNVHEFTFDPKEVTSPGLKGKVSVKATLKSRMPGREAPELSPVTVPIRQFRWETPTFSPRDIKPPSPQTVTFAGALMIIAMVMLAPIGI